MLFSNAISGAPMLPLLTLLLSLSGSASAEEGSLYGTWSSKSNQVFTGPGFYDPVDELLIEPALPGISYSFTEDGWFEEATYQVSGNPKNPSCPKGSLIYQHGRYEVLDNGTMILHPIAVDGRQLFSDPCNDNGVSTYMRYNQTEIFKSFTIDIDPYYGIWTLHLYQFNGAPLQPLYLAYRPPLMLPTETLVPIADATDETEETGNAKHKRSLSELIQRSMENKHRTNAVRHNEQKGFLFSNLVWYISVGMLGVGSLVFLST